MTATRPTATIARPSARRVGWARRTLALVAALLGAGFAATPTVLASAPPATSVPSTEASSGDAGDGVLVSEDDVRAAKAGLGWFLLDNVDRPTNVSDPCPTLSVESVAWYLGQAGELAVSQRPYGPAVVWESEVGGGLVAARCGMDMDQSPEPDGAVGWSLDVSMLDGQATFAQYAVFVGGRDVLIDPVPELRAQLVSTCSNNGTRCTAALEVDDLLLTLRLRGLPGDQGDALARQLVVAITREVVANLGAVSPPE